MTVKELMEILSKQDPDNEVTFTKKTWVNGCAWYDSGHYELETMDEDFVKITSTDKEVDFCY